MNFFVGEIVFERVMFLLFECGVCFERFGGFLACESGELGVFERLHHQVGDAGLADAGKFAAAAGIKVFLGECEAVMDAREGFEADEGLFVSAVGDGIAVGLVFTAYDSAAELV